MRRFRPVAYSPIIRYGVLYVRLVRMRTPLAPCQVSVRRRRTPVGRQSDDPNSTRTSANPVLGIVGISSSRVVEVGKGLRWWSIAWIVNVVSRRRKKVVVRSDASRTAAGRLSDVRAKKPPIVEIMAPAPAPRPVAYIRWFQRVRSVKTPPRALATAADGPFTFSRRNVTTVPLPQNLPTPETHATSLLRFPPILPDRLWPRFPQ